MVGGKKHAKEILREGKVLIVVICITSSIHRSE